MMNEELEYAEMLEIPVETVTVKRRERKKREPEPDLREQLVNEVNEKVSSDPAYAESTPIAREAVLEGRRDKLAKRIVLGEFIAVCLLCATIFLTNIFMADSAINTFVRGLFRGNGEAQADTRVYSDFTLSPVVSGGADVELAVSESGVLTFTGNCSVYPPCAGEIASVGGNAESGYVVEIKHSDTFSTIISGLDAVYSAAGETVRSNIPVGYTDGEGEVRVSFYSEGTLLTCLTVNENTLAWS